MYSEVDRILAKDMAVADRVVTEVLAGARDFDTAALLYRACRQQGETVRKLVDCLIAAVTIRAGTPVLHADADFDALSRNTSLTVHQPRER